MSRYEGESKHFGHIGKEGNVLGNYQKSILIRFETISWEVLLLIIFLISLTALVNAQSFPSQPSQYPQYVGIPSARMNYYAAAQGLNQWCWAASIQMVLNYYGVDITQAQIVERTFGRLPWGGLPNQAGDPRVITDNLNNWSIDNRGRPYIVRCILGQGAPNANILIRELSQQRPVIVGYTSGPQSAHAVVITAVSYINSPRGPIIQTIVVRDPWPSPEHIRSMGRVEYPGAVLANRMQHYWYVNVTPVTR